ncbi:DNA mismatch repair protein MutL [Gracilibacillus halotolerans]|uniref:DNA mismatch repair protein MutL n=1 Tax=Gracilibacillus halotolerans TaxID=74386 RepID=A0A841RJ52_9BACI|nr:DNA mismatch repair endonuclease MutL [Gracilibacillus halotolerans]MBB6511516.1 DNA mismatch repair protein MutL [Gracilibacillus halotolerans]
MDIMELPPHLANKIAAGEVVERPASVVKELVENSIDAGSTNIKVEISEAGLQSIRVIDNGTGIPHEQVKRVFLRHATSKIRSENDLFHVRTLGFRGEALPSIASVSKMTIKTSTGEEAGITIIQEGGSVLSESRTDARKGTDILVENLFYNTPARLKYLKTVHTELGHITDIINRMAFSHPRTRFELHHNGKKLFQTTGKGGLLSIASAVYGMSVAKQMIPIETSTLDYKIDGYIARPEMNRASRGYITTIINGRYVRSIRIAKAIEAGYHTFLPIGRQPIVILNIEMDPFLVDVNVHPTKLEVRFSKEKELLQAIEEMIKNRLHQEILIPSGTEPKYIREKSIQPKFEFETRRDSDRIHQYETNSPENNSVTNERADEKSSSNDALVAPPLQENNSQMDSQPISTVEETTTTMTSEKQRVPELEVIGQHHGTYIMAQNEEGLYIIDQHAAQERIKYEFYREKIGEVTNELQELLVPLTFEFTQQESLLIEQFKEELEQVGLFFELFGQNTYIVRSHPQWFPQGEENEMIRDMVDQLIKDQSINIHKLREEAAILMSCKRSIKANHYLDKQDMQVLLDHLRDCKEPFTCPHGRPIIIHFSQYEMEKMFKRVM